MTDFDSYFRYSQLDEDSQSLGSHIYIEGRCAGESRDEIIESMVVNGIEEADAEAIFNHCFDAQQEEENYNEED